MIIGTIILIGIVIIVHLTNFDKHREKNEKYKNNPVLFSELCRDTNWIGNDSNILYTSIAILEFDKNNKTKTTYEKLRLTKDGEIFLGKLNINNMELSYYTPNSNKKFNTKGAIIGTALGGVIIGAAIGGFGKEIKFDEVVRIAAVDEFNIEAYKYISKSYLKNFTKIYNDYVRIRNEDVKVIRKTTMSSLMDYELVDTNM